MKLILVQAVLLAGCATREPLPEPSIRTVPAKLVADEGASLYVLEAPADWLDNLQASVLPRPTGTPQEKDEIEKNRPGRIGEGTLRRLLRYALSQRGVFFIGHADFQPTDGFPAEATLFNPDAEAHRRTPGSGAVGFRVKMTARSHPDTNEGFDLAWTAEQLTDTPDKTGMGVNRSTEAIETGTTRLPAGWSILVRHPKPDGREYVLLLRVVSLRGP